MAEKKKKAKKTGTNKKKKTQQAAATRSKKRSSPKKATAKKKTTVKKKGTTRKKTTAKKKTAAKKKTTLKKKPSTKKKTTKKKKTAAKKKTPMKKTTTAKKKTAEKKPSVRKIRKGLYGKRDLEHFEKRLHEERQRVLRQLGVFGENYANTLKDSSGDLSSYSFHMADMGTDAMEREKAFLFASQEGRLLYHIDEALRRLYKGESYGKCQSCGNKIQKKRLDALPHARLCIDCKSREESGS